MTCCCTPAPPCVFMPQILQEAVRICASAHFQNTTGHKHSSFAGRLSVLGGYLPVTKSTRILLLSPCPDRVRRRRPAASFKSRLSKIRGNVQPHRPPHGLPRISDER